jgi:hypothetical protein
VFGTSVDSLIKTDIRKIRETPGISISQSTTGIIANNPTPEPSRTDSRFFSNPPEPKPIVKIIDEIFQPKEEPQPVKDTKSYLADNETSFQHFVDNHLHTISNATNGSPTKTEVEIPQKTTNKLTPLVKANTVKEYLANCQKVDYLRSLPTISLPFIQSERSRAFEMGNDFPLQNSIAVGNGISDWSEVKDGKFYILLTTQQGVIYRRVYNQVKIKGALLLSSDNPTIPSFEISIKDVVEIWEVNSFISQQLPEPNISLERVKDLVDDLTHELDRFR